jgi:glycine/D-amino acid oxidase-like deaminating enzyme
VATLIAPHRCDLAVVGAGIVGTMVAQLAATKHPEWTSVLVDRGLPGHGATAYSLALDVGSAANPTVRRLVDDGASISRELAAAMPDCFRTLPAYALVDSATTEGGVFPSRSPKSPSPARGGGSGWGPGGGLRALRTRWPDLVLGPDETVISGLTATCAKPLALVEGLVTGMRRRGVQCWDGTEVTALESEPEGIGLSMADGRKLLAACVVLAIGPWITTGHWQVFATRLGVRVKKIVAMHLDVKPRADDPVVLFMADDSFLLPDVDGDRYLFSFASQEWDVPPDPARLRITPDDRELALEILERRLPGLARHWSGGRVFCDAYTPNRAPLVASLDADRRLCIATGGSGSGFRLAPGMALAALGHLDAAARSAVAERSGAR